MDILKEILIKIEDNQNYLNNKEIRKKIISSFQEIIKVNDNYKIKFILIF